MKEKFKSLNTSFGADVKYYHHNINKCEKIAEEFAIEFALWIRESGNLIILHKQSLPITRLLEEFKKEKGL